MFHKDERPRTQGWSHLQSSLAFKGFPGEHKKAGVGEAINEVGKRLLQVDDQGRLIRGFNAGYHLERSPLLEGLGVTVQIIGKLDILGGHPSTIQGGTFCHLASGRSLNVYWVGLV